MPRVCGYCPLPSCKAPHVKSGTGYLPHHVANKHKSTYDTTPQRRECPFPECTTVYVGTAAEFISQHYLPKHFKRVRLNKINSAITSQHQGLNSGYEHHMQRESHEASSQSLSPTNQDHPQHDHIMDDSNYNDDSNAYDHNQNYMHDETVHEHEHDQTHYPPQQQPHPKLTLRIKPDRVQHTSKKSQTSPDQAFHLINDPAHEDHTNSLEDQNAEDPILEDPNNHFSRMDPLAQMALAASFLRGPKEGQTTVSTDTNDLAKNNQIGQGHAFTSTSRSRGPSTRSHQTATQEQEAHYKQWIIEHNIAKQRAKITRPEIECRRKPSSSSSRNASGNKTEQLTSQQNGTQSHSNNISVFYQDPSASAIRSVAAAQRAGGQILEHHRAEVITPFLSAPSTPSFESVVMDQSESEAHNNMLNSSNSNSPETIVGERKPVQGSGVLSR